MNDKANGGSTEVELKALLSRPVPRGMQRGRGVLDQLKKMDALLIEGKNQQAADLLHELVENMQGGRGLVKTTDSA